MEQIPLHTSSRFRVTKSFMKEQGAQQVSLHGNPYDLRPAVAAIVQRVEQVRATLGNKKLVILMGEDHSVSSHVLLQYLTVAALHRRYPGRVGFSAELPYNLVAGSLEDRGHTPEEVDNFLRSDVDGQLTLREYLEAGHRNDAPYARRSLFEFCYQKKIPTCFSDVACSGYEDKFIDSENMYMADTLDRLGVPADQRSIETFSPLGFFLRNIFMWERSRGHMDVCGIDTLVMGSGARHIFGARKRDEVSDTLSCLFARAGMECLSVLPLERQIFPECIPVEAAEFFPNTVVVSGLNEREFFVDGRGDEIGYISKVMDRSGQLSAVSTGEAYAVERTSCYSLVPR